MWETVSKKLLPQNFKPRDPKSPDSILVINAFVANNNVVKRYTQVQGKPPSPPYDMMIFSITNTISQETSALEKINIDYDENNLMDNRLYTIKIDNYPKKYGFIYRPDEQAIVQYEGVV